MAQVEIVGLGLATVDVLIRLEDMPTWERGGSFRAVKIEGGGLVGTAMCAAARLGARAAYVGTAGGDAFGDMKWRSLEEYGVDLTHAVRRDSPEEHIVVVYVNERDGERVFAGGGKWRRDVLTVDEIDRDFISSARLLHLDGFQHEAALQAARWMREAGGKVVFDGSKTKGPIGDGTRALLEHVDVLISGSGFVEALTGHAKIADAGPAALDTGLEVVVQTEGEEGCHTFTRDGAFHTAAFDLDVVDTTGAGDVFHGAYLVGMLRGWHLETIARFSSAVAAIVCTQLGGRSGIPTFDETVTFLEDRGIKID